MTPLAAVAGTASDTPATDSVRSRDEAPGPLDDTAESLPDTAATLADDFSHRAEILLLATQGHQQQLQARLDRMRGDFNAKQEERSEKLREMNMLRDMAMEQNKHDDEILKKFIAMI
jgi:hypothetical protein